MRHPRLARLQAALVSPDSSIHSDGDESTGRGETSPLMERLLEFLSALCDPQGGAALYGLHTSDAPLRGGDGVEVAAKVDPTTFARTHQDISLRGADRLPAFSDPVLLEVHASAEGPESVAWLEVRETRSANQLTVAFGVRTVAGVPGIVWSTLAERVQPWSFRDGLLQALADYPRMRASDPTVPRALLDAAYFRRYWRPPLRLNTLPQARFSCQMTTACCRHDFDITLPPQAQLLIDALPWHTIKPGLADTRLPVRADGTLQLKGPNETCRFLGPRNMCLIHQTLGRQPFRACCVFPFSFAHTPEGISVGLSPICGSVRMGLGADPQDCEDDLRERLAHASPRSTNAYRLAPGIEISWEPFRDTEKALCDCLTAADLPIRRRLYVGARLLGALRDNQPIDVKAWLAEPAVAVTTDLAQAIHGMLGRIIGWNRATLRRLPREIPADLRTQELREPVMMTEVLRNTLFCKVYSYPFDLTTAFNYLIVLYLLALIMQTHTAPLGEPMWRELGSLGVHGLLKSVLHDDMPDGFRALLGTAEFGMWMLSV